ncbi:MAG: putative aminohydrolase SsnA [Elusimicrobiota bacterium]
MSKSLLIKNAVVFTGPLSLKLLKGYNIYIKDGIICDIFKTSNLKNIKAERVIDAKGGLVMPGFINVHMHFYSTFARGLSKIKPSKNFVEVLKNLWWKLDKKLGYEAIYYSALSSAISAIRKGTTTFIDHHASPFSITGSLFEIEKAIKKAGLRASLCYEVSDRDGEKKAEEGLKENYEFIKYVRKNGGNKIKALFGLHASFTLSNKTLEIASDLGNSLDAGFHVHCAEADSDEKDCVKKHKMRVVERFDKFKILGPKTILAHCVHINEDEIELIRKSATVVAINPQSNANNAVGISDIIGFARKAILYGLGTDAMTVNMLEELRFALWLCHLKNSNPSVGFNEVSALIANNVKIALRHFEKIGEIQKGYYADMVIFNYFPPTPFETTNFYGHLIFGISAIEPSCVIVDGNVLMEDKKLNLDIDEREISRKSIEISKKIWKNF